MKTFVILALLLLSPQQDGVGNTDTNDGLAIIINSENIIEMPEDRTVAMLRRLYLKQKTTWPDGRSAIVFARPGNSVEEIAFRRSILGMSDNQLHDHWLRMKQTQGETPPRSVDSVRILLRQIRNKPEAVSIVSRKDLEKYREHAEGTKILFEFSQSDNHD